MRHPKWLCPLLGCTRGYYVPVVIEVGFNGCGPKEAEDQLKEIMPGVESRMREYFAGRYPLRISTGKAKRV